MKTEEKEQDYNAIRLGASVFVDIPLGNVLYKVDGDFTYAKNHDDEALQWYKERNEKRVRQMIAERIIDGRIDVRIDIEDVDCYSLTDDQAKKETVFDYNHPQLPLNAEEPFTSICKRTETTDEHYTEEIIAIIQDRLCNGDEVAWDDMLGDDLCCDSLDSIELVMDFEKTFNIHIEDEEIEAFRNATVQQVVDRVLEIIHKQHK